MRWLSVIIFLVELGHFVVPQTVSWDQDSNIRVDHYNVIVDKYYNRFSPAGQFPVFHTYGAVELRIAVSITRFNFVKNGPSFGILLGWYQVNDTQFTLYIGYTNQTVFYRLNVDVLTYHSAQNKQFYVLYGSLNSKILDKGQGYRSQNISLTHYRWMNSPDEGTANFLLCPLHFLILNPDGQYITLNWKKHINATHLTVQFQTNQKNKVIFVSFYIFVFDYFFVNTNRQFRLLSIWTSICPGANCLGTGGLPIDNRFKDVHKQFWGVTGYNFTKNQDIQWFLDTTSYSDMSLGYIQSPGIVFIKISGFLITRRQCLDFDSDNMTDQYYDPGTQQCVLNCTNPPYIYQHATNQICAKCHYTCLTCNSYFSNSCQSCDSNHLRYLHSLGYCFCNPGYGQSIVGQSICRRCNLYMPGCKTCARWNHCYTCQPGLYVDRSIRNDSCLCINTSQTKTRSGECVDIIACLGIITASNGTQFCTQCNRKNNFTLVSYKCECMTGFEMTYLPDGITPVCIQLCGNSKLTQTEECDDGNYIAGDGCNQYCKIQPSFACFAELTDKSFCLKDYAVLRYYKCLKNQNSENTVDIYFSFFPYEEKFMLNISFFQSLLCTSLQDKAQFTDFRYNFYEYDRKEIRFILSVKYKERVNYTVENLMKFQIRDSVKANYLSASVIYKLESKNYPLYFSLNPSQSTTYRICSQIILSFIIGAYIVAALSVFTENWIGIQLLHTFQFLFFYCFLFRKMDGQLAQFVNVLKFSTGFNVMRNYMSLFEYHNFQDKLYRFKYGKEFLLNFNYSAILFGIPLLLFIVKALKPSLEDFFGIQKTRKSKYRLNSNKISNRGLPESFFLSSNFIIGKLSLSIGLVLLFPILLSFCIQQTYHETNDKTLGLAALQLIIVALMSIQFGLLGLLYIDTVKRLNFVVSASDSNDSGFFQFKRFRPLYPLIYTFLQTSKFLFLILTYENETCLYYVLGIDSLYLMWYCIIRPYAKQRDNQKNFCYFLHNLHNIFNSFGLVIFSIIVLTCNLQTEEDIRFFSPIIAFYILCFQACSLFLAVMRVFFSKRIAKCCEKDKLQIDDSQYLSNRYEKKGLQRSLKKLKDKEILSKQKGLRDQVKRMRRGVGQKNSFQIPQEEQNTKLDPKHKLKPVTKRQIDRVRRSRTVVKYIEPNPKTINKDIN